MRQTLIEKSNLECEAIASLASRSPCAVVRGEDLPHFTERSFSLLFEDQVIRDPNATALICETERLSFGELNARANQLARHLRALGVGRESLVAVCIDRSLEMAVGIIGILKAGAAYLPLDPDYPKERLVFMLDDAQPAIVLTKAELNIDLTKEMRTVLLDEHWPLISENSVENLSEHPERDDLAYVIYTSGSTGKPKGAMVEHRNLANYLLALNHELKIDRNDLYLHTASIAFSSSRRQLLLPLSQGAGVVIANSAQRKDPIALFQMIKARGITVMDAVPTFWRNCTTVLADLSNQEREQLIDNRLRLMLSASEPLLSDVPQTWMAAFKHRAQHVHMFGQTETAGAVCLFRIPHDLNGDVRILPIGRPIANTEIHILDEDKQPCAIDVAGELYIGGAGVGRGYLNQPQLTTEKFIDIGGARFYRTGDWARLRADNEIEFAGRRDQQVKLRGFRVELGEVEAALLNHESIRECVVVARENGVDKKLIAYFVASTVNVSIGELRQFLTARLPEYAIPSAFVRMHALPLSANGKIDRLALPKPEKSRADLSTSFVSPRTEIEDDVASIWREVLGVEPVGCEDNFFELGGHSLLAAQIAARIRRKFAFDLPISALFESPTVALLAKRIIVARSTSAVGQSIQPSVRNGAVPLSFTQQQFWLLNQASVNRSAYNVRTAIRITGTLKFHKLQQSIDAVVARHEALRTNIAVHDGTPSQMISGSMSINLAITDISKLSKAESEAAIDRAFADEAAKPFDLASGPLLRARLLKLDEQEHLLLITLHHIVCDGWSINVLMRELTLFYNATTDAATLPRLSIQYADFARWQRQWLQGETLVNQLDYWKRQLTDAPTAVNLLTDYSRSTSTNMAGGRASIVLSKRLSNALRNLSRTENATMFMTMLAAFQILLSRYSGQDEVVVGSPVAGRTMIETEALIGAFVNTLVLRGDLGGNPTFRELLGRVRDTVLAALSHQDLPLEKLVEELNPERTTNGSPLFNVMFAFQNTPPPEVAINGSRFMPVPVQSNTAKFDLSLDVQEQADSISVSFEYASALFLPETIERMLANFEILLTDIVADPSERITNLSVLTADQCQQLLVDWNHNPLDFPQDTCTHHLFESQAAKTPNAIAAEFCGEQLSYRELNNRSNQLAHYLRNRGVGPEVLVGISLDRSLEILVAILGVMKAGGGYVPLDPNYPGDRIAFMIDDAELSLVITQQRLMPQIPNAPDFVCIDSDWEKIGKESEENPCVKVAANNIAYVIYTSGSTGNPKGVMIEHRSLVHFTFAAIAAYEIKPEDRILQFASLSFDLSAEEIYPALTQGATVVLRTDNAISSVEDFLRYCDEHRISVIDLPTAYWHELTDALSSENLELPISTRLVIIGGEKASPDRVVVWQQRVSSRVRLVNSYGPTETTVAVTTGELKPDHGSATGGVPIGRPLANTSVYVLDRALKPVPIGVAGELHVGGPGVARGYINRPDLTANKFIRNPFADDPATRLYKTGDIVRYRADGNLEFLGRVDNQIKIRGFRVELEEIEQALRSHEGVIDCIVVLREDHDKRLVAYVVAETASTPAARELRNFLKARLPAYMVPAAFETIDALPLLPSGKINRTALPEPQAQVETGEMFVAPATPLEELLASAWGEVLNIERVGVHDNFFDLGGHSLLAAKIVSVVCNVLDIRFGMVDVFLAPTVRDLAALLYPRVAEKETDGELAGLLKEIAAMSEEEAQRRFNYEMKRSEAT